MGFRLPGTNTVEKPQAESVPQISTPRPEVPLVDGLTGGEPVIGQSEDQVDRTIASAEIPEDVFNQVLDQQAKIPTKTVARPGMETRGGIPKKVFDEVLGAEPVVKPDPLYPSKVLARGVDVKQVQNIKEISEKLKIPTSDAAAMLANKPFDELKAIPELQNLDKDYPGVVTWAKNPDNYKLLLKDPNYAKKTESNVTKLGGFFKDASRVVEQNYYTLQQMGLHSAVARGIITPETAAYHMQGIQDKIDVDPFVELKTEANEIRSGVQSLTNRMTRAKEYYIAAERQAAKDKDSLFNEIRKYYLKPIKEAGLGVLDLGYSLAKNPAAALLFGLQSASSAVPSIVTATAGGLGGAYAGGSVGASLGGIPGLALGVGAGGLAGTTLGSFSGEYFTAYSQFLLEEQDRFRNPKTGKVDFVQMYKDPAVVERMKDLASKYGSAQALFSSVGSAIAGRTVLKSIDRLKEAKDITSKYKAVLKTGAAFGGETIVNAGLEGAGETTAQIAVGKPVEQAVREGVIESFMSLPLSGGEVLVQTLVNRRTQDLTRENIIALKKEKDKAESALNNKEILTNLRKDKQSSPIPNEHPQQAQDLIVSADTTGRQETGDNRGTAVEPTPTYEEDFLNQEEALSDKYSEETNKRPTFMQFNVTQFEQLADSKGLDPQALADQLGPNASAEYVKAKSLQNPEFSIDYADYYRYGDDHPELDDIAHVNGEEYNFVDSVGMLADLEMNFNNLPESKMETFDEEGGPGPVIYEMEGEPQDGDPVLRPIQLMQVGRSAEERTVFQNIKKSLSRALLNTPSDAEVADLVTEFQFRHTRFRAEMLNQPITEIADQLKIGFKKAVTDDGKTIAYFQPGGDFVLPRSKVVFGPRTKANAVIHEFAHSWLHNMAVDYKAVSQIQNKTERQQEYFDAMESAAKLLGVNKIDDIFSIPKAQYHKIHETWAQTAEKYFLEGDFKDSRVRQVFESMRKWMIQLVSIIAKAYPHFPPLKISPEVSRVFQTILDTNNAVEDSVSEMFQPPMFNREMLGAKYDEYIGAIRDAREQAVAQMYSNVFNKKFNEREKEISNAYNVIYDSAAEEIANLPSMRLMDGILSRGPESSITIQSIADVLANGDMNRAMEIRKRTPRGIIGGVNKKGVDVREVMRYMGINDPSAMEEVFNQMAERDQMIENLANRKIDEQFPILKSDEQIHQEAVQAVNGAGREKILALELENLADMSLKKLQKINAKAVLPAAMVNRKALPMIKEQADKYVMNALVTNMRPRDFLNASARHGRRASDFVARGDFESAFWEKQQEAINFFAYGYARAASNEISKTQKLMKKIISATGRDMDNRYDPDIYQFAQNLIVEFDQGRALTEVDPYNFQRSMFLDSNRVDLINKYINAINASMVGKTPKTVDVQTFMAFGELLRMVRKISIESMSVEVENEKINKEQLGTLVAQNIGPRKSTDPKKSMDSGLISRWKADLINVRTLFAGLMSEESFAKSALARLVRRVFDAEARYNAVKSEDERILSEAVKKIALNNPDMQKVLAPLTKRFLGTFYEADAKPIFAPEINYTFANEGELHRFMLYMGSESGQVKLGLGGLLNEDGSPTGTLGFYDPQTGNFMMPKVEAMINRLQSQNVLRKEHYDFYQTVWDLFDKHYAESKESIRSVYGYNIGKILPKTVVTPWGEYRGGYVPLKRNQTYNDLATSVADFAIDTPGTFVKDLFPMANTTFTRQRIETYYPLSLDLGQLRYELNSVYRVAYLMKPMYELGKVLDTVQVRASIDNRAPGAMKAIVIPWFKRTMAQQYADRAESPSGKAVDQAAAWLRKTYRIKAFAFNYTTFMKQYLGLFPAMNIIDNSILIRAATEVAFNPAESQRRVRESSKRMAVRMDDNARRAIKSFEDFTLNDDWLSKLDQNIEKIVYGPIQWAQNHVDTIVFLGAVDQAKKMGMTDEAQIYGYAADVVERTQLSSNISSRPGVLQSSEAVRLFTDFTSVPLAMYGLNYETFRRTADATLSNKVLTRSFALAVTAAIPSIVGYAITNPGKLTRSIGDEEEAEEYAKSMAAEVAREAVDVVFPVAGRNVVSLFDSRDSALTAPALGTFKTLYRGIVRPSSKMVGLNENDMELKDLRAMIDSITILTGIPVSALNRGFGVLTEINPELDPNR